MRVKLFGSVTSFHYIFVTQFFEFVRECIKKGTFLLLKREP